MKTSVCMRLGLALIAVLAGLSIADWGPVSAQQPKAPALSEVIAKLDSKQAAQQLKAIDEIGSRGPAAAAAVPRLVELLSAKSGELRWARGARLSGDGTQGRSRGTQPGQEPE